MGKWEHKNIEYVLPEEIEKRSFAIIAAELAERGVILPAEQDMITRRVIHTSADFDYAQTMIYSENAVEIAKDLLKNGADIVTDTNMALAGINKKVLASFGGEAHCRTQQCRNSLPSAQRWQQWQRNAGPPGQRSAWSWHQNGKNR